ncbi:hypothetical protein tb265_07460 [Gemmatimonadetes bacterium T265]|nr:hypothetical protein tb265_07460 [Gemmatimonadetes bacterium T265]
MSGPPVGGPPDNAGFMYAAYALGALVYVGYALVLVRRRARARRALDMLAPGERG